MPRAVLDIAMNDDAFKNFLEKYQNFHEKLKAMPGFWTQSSTAAGGASASTGTMAEAIAAGAASSAVIAEALDKSEASSARASLSMGKIAGHAKDAAKSIFEATEKLAKWAVLSLGAGLIGGGVGLFGLDRLAESMSGQRKSALGLGITTAEQKAFEINFGSRVVGSDFLQNIANAQSSYEDQWKFTSLGIANPMGRDAGEVGIDVINAAHRAWQNLPPGNRTVENMKALGLDGLMTFNDWRRMGNMSPADLARNEAQYRRDASGLTVNDPTQKAWQDFMVKLNEAGALIDTAFVKGLEPLIKSDALPKVSDAIVHLVEKFFANPSVNRWVDEFAQLIGKFGDWLGGDKFEKDVRSVVDGMAYAAGKMASIMRFLGLLPGDAGITTDANDPSLPTITGPLSKLRSGLGFENSPYNFSLLETKTGLPQGLLKAVGWEESRLNPNIGDSPAGAQGMFQIMPGTARDYHITDPHDPTQSAHGAALFLRDMIKKFHGDVAQGLAAYNWGPGNVEEDIKAHGSDWRQNLPPETTKYLNDVLSKVQVDVKVTNNTAANVAVTANATAR